MTILVMMTWAVCGEKWEWMGEMGAMPAVTDDGGWLCLAVRTRRPRPDGCRAGGKDLENVWKMSGVVPCFSGGRSRDGWRSFSVLAVLTSYFIGCYCFIHCVGG